MWACCSLGFQCTNQERKERDSLLSRITKASHRITSDLSLEEAVRALQMSYAVPEKRLHSPRSETGPLFPQSWGFGPAVLIPWLLGHK